MGTLSSTIKDILYFLYEVEANRTFTQGAVNALDGTGHQPMGDQLQAG